VAQAGSPFAPPGTAAPHRGGPVYTTSGYPIDHGQRRRASEDRRLWLGRRDGRMRRLLAFALARGGREG
jgi:hypothetical protein